MLISNEVYIDKEVREGTYSLCSKLDSSSLLEQEVEL